MTETSQACNCGGRIIIDDNDYVYREGMARKLNSLESGLIEPTAPTTTFFGRLGKVCRLSGPSWPRSAIACVLLTLGLMLAMMLSFFIWVGPKAKALSL